VHLVLQKKYIVQSTQVEARRRHTQTHYTTMLIHSRSTHVRCIVNTAYTESISYDYLYCMYIFLKKAVWKDVFTTLLFFICVWDHTSANVVRGKIRHPQRVPDILTMCTR
jgi:hypothetical protein